MGKLFKLITLKTPSSVCKTCALDSFCENNIKEKITKRKCSFYSQYEFVPVNKLKRRRF